MTKFVEAMEACLHPERQVKAKMPKVLMEPMGISEDYARIGHLDRYLLTLKWNTSIWLETPVLPTVLEEARKEAISNMKWIIYGEIFEKIQEAKFMLKHSDEEEGFKKVDELLAHLMS